MVLLGYNVERLPAYLQDLVRQLIGQNSTSTTGDRVQVLDTKAISQVDSAPSQYIHYLLRRHALTDEIAKVGLHPPLLYERALVYEALGYADLAAADAFVTYTLCETVRSEEWISDLKPIELCGGPWPLDNDSNKNLATLCDALAVLSWSLLELGATEDADEKFNELVERYGVLLAWNGDRAELINKTKDRFHSQAAHLGHGSRKWDIASTAKHKFGWSRREIYPWNNHEPDRNSAESLAEINSALSQVAPDLVAKVTVLPALNEDGSLSEEIWHQLGLFAAKDLPSGTQIMQEKSLLTAIRPLDDALCDACGADLESASRDNMRQCPGEDCDTTFCSEDCAARAAKEYHKPNVSEDTDTNTDANEDNSEYDPDYPSPHVPFCGNTALHEIGRTATTTTPEWDLYFLLLTRTIQMSTTQQIHPLSLPTTKFLWGDFYPPPFPSSPFPPSSTTNTNTKSSTTLPWSLHHNLTLPLQFFETIMHSLPTTMKPYSGPWLANFDWWIQSTLLAKFRGVANAQQSTFDGKAEIAAVHPMWCLANHSCEPNVTWTPTGERVFAVRDKDELVGRHEGEWVGIREGEEIWSHYTDIRLPVGKRRERLLEVLGGVCRCSRCLREAEEERQEQAKGRA